MKEFYGKFVENYLSLATIGIEVKNCYKNGIKVEFKIICDVALTYLDYLELETIFKIFMEETESNSVDISIGYC